MEISTWYEAMAKRYEDAIQSDESMIKPMIIKPSLGDIVLADAVMERWCKCDH